MTLSTDNSKVTIHNNLRHFFQESLTQVLKSQQVAADDATIFYIVNLLTDFSRSENFFDHAEEGLMIKPLATHYCDALQASSEKERNTVMQRMGDVALFVSGIFSQSLDRKVVGIDYYINMGGSAYAYLADKYDYKSYDTPFSTVFSELSEKFICFVDVLNEISEAINASRDTNILKMYEMWLQTGSKRLEKVLIKQGLQLNTNNEFQIQH